MKAVVKLAIVRVDTNAFYVCFSLESAVDSKYHERKPFNGQPFASKFLHHRSFTYAVPVLVPVHLRSNIER